MEHHVLARDSFIESLQQVTESSDFGLFVLAPDDFIQRADGQQVQVARDNVIFEAGMFFTAVGKGRAFILTPFDCPDYHLPTDLHGIDTVTYDHQRPDNNWAAATGPPSMELLTTIQRLGPRERRTSPESLSPSPKTPDNSFVNSLVDGALETVCRALSVPQTADALDLRIFIFRKCEEQLVCTHFWSHNPTREMVDVLKFPLSEDWSHKAVVVRTALTGEPASQNLDEKEMQQLAKIRKVQPNLKFVLAAPIFDNAGEVTAVVDFDTSTAAGQTLLDTQVAASTLFGLAQLLGLALSL